MTDKAILRESIDLENQADSYALNCKFGPAVSLMREANRLRASVFGRAEPNTLRDLTYAALSE